MQLKIVKDDRGVDWIMVGIWRSSQNRVFLSRLEEFNLHKLRILAVDFIALVCLGGWSALTYKTEESAYAGLFWMAAVPSILAARGVRFTLRKVVARDSGTPLGLLLVVHFLLLCGIFALLLNNIFGTAIL